MIKSLTSLRFFFALIIFMHHFIWGSERMFPEGGVLAVTFFFILSGFVLAYSYRDRFLSGDYSKKTFWIGRVSKLYPLHFLCFGIAFILAWKAMSLSLLLVAPINLALLQSWIPLRSIYFSYNAVSWFSSDMLFFYLMFPCLVVGLSKMKLHRIGIWSIAIFVFYIILTKLIPADLVYAIFYINPLIRLLDFMLGIILFLIFENFKQKIWRYQNS